MIVTLADQNTMRLSFRYASRRLFEQVKDAVKALPGREYDAETKTWLVPIRQLDTVMATFPKASYSYDVLCASDVVETARFSHFYDALACWGVKLHKCDSGAILAVGENVSPLLQEEIDKRRDGLWPLIEEGAVTAVGVTQDAPEPESEARSVDDRESRLMAAMADGMKNARKQEQRKQHHRDKWRRERGLVQERLI